MQSTQRHVAWVTIPSGSSDSAEVNLDRGTIVGIVMPTTWDAANITLRGMLAGGTFVGVLTDDGNELVLATSPAASKYIAVRSSAQITAPGRVKIRSGTNGSAVNQTADRALGIVILLPA